MRRNLLPRKVLQLPKEKRSKKAKQSRLKQNQKKRKKKSSTPLTQKMTLNPQKINWWQRRRKKRKI